MSTVDDWITITQLAGQLHCKRDTIEQWIKRWEMPQKCYRRIDRVGRNRILISESRVRAWLAARDTEDKSPDEFFSETRLIVQEMRMSGSVKGRCV